MPWLDNKPSPQNPNNKLHTISRFKHEPPFFSLFMAASGTNNQLHNLCIHAKLKNFKRKIHLTMKNIQILAKRRAYPNDQITSIYLYHSQQTSFCRHPFKSLAHDQVDNCGDEARERRIRRKWQHRHGKLKHQPSFNSSVSAQQQQKWCWQPLSN